MLRISTQAPLPILGSMILMIGTSRGLALTMLPLLFITSAVIVIFVGKTEPLFRVDSGSSIGSIPSCKRTHPYRLAPIGKDGSSSSSQSAHVNSSCPLGRIVLPARLSWPANDKCHFS